MELVEFEAIIKAISQSCSEQLDRFTESLHPLDELTPHVEEEGYLFNICANVKSLIDCKVERAFEIVDNNAQLLEKEKSEINKLEEELSNLTTEFGAKKNKLRETTKRCETYNHKLQNLKSLKLSLYLYKLLTATQFDYTRPNTGYMVRTNPPNYEVFNYGEIGEEQVVRKLWALMEKMAHKNE
ncbi:hypothetical protein TcasGA2_TC032942 [Tribolium castaneum]|uniref:Kinetochore protein Spc24 n=1 Tax=Tribolium castaneum TaxID=7070 RepID=A0A139WJE6_TRICA|nr:PREDICTED: uncharacterized protein LOC103312846 [Tribolium castaneum]KYB28158.1 hypothetical protein TcasGA2_TC032942 [Tribolium castaneum]|eukprot:XP_008192779.1 PREDICTED: uncharacterized protein LOC103312846 [Tribolium castaneum]